MTTRAAIYVRSSKDRNDVSLNAQRRELQQLAIDRDLAIVAEYADAVESGKDENRPGFQRLIADIGRPDRGWTMVLMLDTSRLARRTHIAHAFQHECERRGVKVAFARIPDTDPVTSVILHSVFTAMDEVHSLMSRQKGLAGMRENVARGFRAGGRAPRGYRLQRIPIGVVREGRELTKTRLEPDELAGAVGRYLRARASGAARKTAARQAGLEAPHNSLIGTEWNALTYAGHTVWNVHNEHGPGGYHGHVKRRPRAEWQIQRDTHPALITDAEAEALLAALETSTRGAARKTGGKHLLSGLLLTPDGVRWQGGGRGEYRTTPGKGARSRWVKGDELDTAVLDQVSADMRSQAFARDLARAARAWHRTHQTDNGEDLRARLNEIGARIGKMVRIAGELEDPDPALREIDAMERERKVLLGELEMLDREREAAEVMAKVTPATVTALLEEITARMTGLDRDQLKDFLRQILEKVELDPATLACRIHYRLAVSDRNRVASPRPSDAIAALRLVRAAAWR